MEDQEPDLPYTKDLEHPLGHLAFTLSDSHGNRAHVACDVNRPVEGTSMVWEKLKRSDEVAVNVTLLTMLECEIDRDTLQNLWRLVAYYYESPAILERGARHENTSKVTFQYSQVTNGTLIINKVTLADQGKYTCVARNSAGDDIKNVKLQVEVSEPYINGKSGRTDSRVLGVSYQTVLMHCKAEGMPEPQITWMTSFGMSLPTPYVGGRFQVHKNGTLELRGIRKTD
ncbi:hypothetical protein QTP70_016814, partial [Hemibagrus guttatus]